MQSEYRLKVLSKIDELEKKELWDCDVEDDPAAKELLPDDIDYLGKKFSTRFFTKIANRCAINFYEKAIKKNQFIIKEIKGIENYLSVDGGAMITCNHFSPYDNYAIFRAIRPYLKKERRQLYKVIREGNYTNFKGLYGFFFRHCNTLPLSRNLKTMKKFLESVNILLKRGEKILIYPEQAMWWNYKKPRPMKSGAFKFAVKSGVPVIPSFITMEDTEYIDAEGFKIPAYTVWFLPPIYPEERLSDKEQAERMMKKNYELWKDLYEKVYNIPLEYLKKD